MIANNNDDYDHARNGIDGDNEDEGVTRNRKTHTEAKKRAK